MVKPGFTDGRDYSNDSAALGRADAILDELARDGPVAPAKVADARDTLLDVLWRGGSRGRGTAERGLLTLYAKTDDPGDRAQMIGEFYAAGPRGESLLDEVLRGAPSTNVSRQELEALRDGAKLPIADRLKFIVAALEAEGERKEGRGRTPRGADPPPEAAIVPTNERSGRAGRTFSSGSAPPDRKEALADLEDPKVPTERRHERARELGRDAVQTLGAMLVRGGADGEFALAALVDLGRQRATARAVDLEMRNIEARDGGGRRAAELVRHAIDRGNNDGFDDRARDRIRGANVSDRWLRSALESCDSRSILRAAAGREPLAIALGARVLHELRAAGH
jgi:hypothetical protein